MLSIMVGSVTERLVPDSPGNFWSDGNNSTADYDVIARDLSRMEVAAATTVLAGLIQVSHILHTNISCMPHDNPLLFATLLAKKKYYYDCI